MASKLTAKVTEVSTLVGKLKDAITQYLQHRIQLSTMVDVVIPKAKATGKEQGYTYESATKTARDLKDKKLNTVLWNQHFIKELQTKLYELQTMLDAYDPAVMKKSGPVTDPQKIKARTELKAMAVGIVVKTKALIVDVQKTLRA